MVLIDTFRTFMKIVSLSLSLSLFLPLSQSLSAYILRYHTSANTTSLLIIQLKKKLTKCARVDALKLPTVINCIFLLSFTIVVCDHYHIIAICSFLKTRRQPDIPPAQPTLHITIEI